jgi:hypothetical protein
VLYKLASDWSVDGISVSFAALVSRHASGKLSLVTWSPLSIDSSVTYLCNRGFTTSLRHLSTNEKT